MQTISGGPEGDTGAGHGLPMLALIRIQITCWLRFFLGLGGPLVTEGGHSRLVF